MTKSIKHTTALLLCALLLLAMLPAPVPALAANPQPWDGATIDVSWYNKTGKAFYISTPEQLMGLAAIVNGIYNKEITKIIGDAAHIVPYSASGEGNEGSNNLSTDNYYYGADDFNGKTVYLTAELDMGGVYNAGAGAWTGPNFMPIGGQYLMELNNSETKIGSSFCGVLDGQGHYIRNIYCNRRCTTGNFGDGQSVGLIGRLGVHDNDPVDMRPKGAAVRNLAVTGYIYSNRSVGGIVGKIGKTDGGAIIENCANFASVRNTDAKGCGGIVGAGWNGGIVRNCYNAGDISSTYACPTGGISGSNEIPLENCYSIGRISAARDNFAMAIGTNNGGASMNDVTNCWYLDGSAPGGGYYTSNDANNSGALTSAYMKSGSFVSGLGDAFAADVNSINDGYPILAWQAGNGGSSDVPDTGLENHPRVTFSDVAETAWYYGAVNYVVGAGLFTGTSGTTFSPGGTMTRAMFVTVLHRIAGTPAPFANGGAGAERGGLSFTDVPQGQWYTDAIQWASAEGHVNGTSADKFSPTADISLEQMITVLYRYSGSPEASTQRSAPNSQLAAEAADWAKDAMSWAVENELFAGVGGSLGAKSAATRAQVAAILMNYGE